MARGSRKGESKAGPEWLVHDVWAGADPDDWEFYPPQDIPQEAPGHTDSATSAACEAFFTQPRRRGG